MEIAAKMCRTERTLAIAACGTAIGTLLVVALFQSGAMDRLPDPPARIFDSERITLSKMAHPLGIPDSFLGLGSYGATLTLLLLADRHRWARRTLGLKLMGDGAAAAFNAVRQVKVFGKLCSWCTGTALATGVMVYAGRKAVVGFVKFTAEVL